MLQAIANGTLLTISGEAARPDYSRVVVQYIGDIEVTDNNQVDTNIPVQGDASAVRHLDLRGLTGAGAHIYWDAPHNNRITGSSQSDYITASGLSNDTLLGGKGDDLLFGGDGNDLLSGDRGHDQLNGGNGDDRINGGAGNDTIDGGAGIDTMIFRGARDEYDIELVNGNYVITDILGARRDGSDTFANVEFLQFSDQIMEIDNVFV